MQLAPQLLGPQGKNTHTIPYCQHTIDEKDIEEIVDSLRSDWLTAGPKTLRFERQFAHYVGAKHAVAVNSCTAALHIALRAVGVSAGDEVITTPLTFCATTEVVEYQNARPVFVDVDESSFNLHPAGIEAAITGRTRAILAVHYGGIPCNLREIRRIADQHALPVIEDAAHALGTIYDGGKIGSHGNLTAFSFYPTKNMTTGEGGVVTTDDDALAERMKILSLHGISKDAWKRYSNQGHWYYEVHELGYKYNFTDLQASLGIQQLAKLNAFNTRREELARRYFDALKELPGIDMPDWYARYFQDLRHSGVSNCWHLFVVMLTPGFLRIDRNQFIEELKQRGIGTSVHFIPLHLQPYYAKKYGFSRGDFPVAESVYDRMLSIPLYPRLSDQNVDYIISVLTDLVRTYRR